jgi:uncharacterized membrane protein YfcA
VTLPVDPAALAAGALVVAAGYVIFACTGFGASLITVPIQSLVGSRQRERVVSARESLILPTLS